MANIKGLEPETGNTIGNLSNNTPLKIDPVSQGDDHIRAVKRATQATFPSVGLDTVNLTTGEVNQTYNLIFIGMISHFHIVVGTVLLPSGWYPCDGGEYLGVTVPNTINKFIKVMSATEPTGTTGGSHTAVPPELTDPHTLIESEMPPHTHTVVMEHGVGGETQAGSGYSALNEYEHTSELSYVGGGLGHTHAVITQDNRPLHTTLITAIYLGIEEIV